MRKETTGGKEHCEKEAKKRQTLSRGGGKMILETRRSPVDKGR